MPTFLAIHTRYHDVQIGLYKNDVLLDSTYDENKRISKNFIYLTQNLLEKHNISLNDLDFIAAHQGPAPFTTLRVVLASINGLSFATQIPLVGIDGLEVFVKKYQQDNCGYTIAILNAFCDDIYFAITNHKTKSFHKGYAPAQRFIQETAQTINENILFIGNGVEMHNNLIKECFKSNAYFIEPNPEMCDLSTIANRGLELFKNKENITSNIMPLYLKDQSAIIHKNL